METGTTASFREAFRLEMLFPDELLAEGGAGGEKLPHLGQGKIFGVLHGDGHSPRHPPPGRFLFQDHLALGNSSPVNSSSVNSSS